jgi:hypothetical protein
MSGGGPAPSSRQCRHRETHHAMAEPRSKTAHHVATGRQHGGVVPCQEWAAVTKNLAFAVDLEGGGAARAEMNSRDSTY